MSGTCGFNTVVVNRTREALQKMPARAPATGALPLGRLLRGGKIEYCSLKSIGMPKTILNLRMAADTTDIQEENSTHKIKFIHEALPNNIDKYETDRRDVKEWIIRLLKIFESLDPVNDFPVFVHCASGRDRTGILISILLRVLGYDMEDVLAEYLLSDETTREMIGGALAPIEAAPGKYYRGMNLDKIRRNLLGPIQNNQ